MRKAAYIGASLDAAAVKRHKKMVNLFRVKVFGGKKLT